MSNKLTQTMVLFISAEILYAGKVLIILMGARKATVICVAVAFSRMKLSEAIDLVFVQVGGLREKAETIRGYENSARLFCLHIHNPEVELVSVLDVDRYLKECENAGFKRNTLTHRAAALRTLFHKLKRLNYRVLDYTDITIPKREIRIPKVATDEQIAKFLAQVPEDSKNPRDIRNRAMLLFLRDTGMRVGEMVALDLKDMDLENKRTLVKTEKSRGTRPIRLVCWYEDCNRALLNWIDARKKLLKRVKKADATEATFIAAYGWQTGQRLTNSGAEIAFRKISRNAKMATLNPHSLRHRKGHLLAMQGANNSIISGVLGHASLSSSFIYTMMNDHELEKAARAFGEEKVLGKL